MRFAPLLAAVVAFASAGLALAQETPQISRELFTDRLNRDGDAIRLCVNPDAMLAEFDEKVAKLLGDALLLDVTVVPVKPPTRTAPYDYRLPIDFNQLFIVLAERCDGFMGFVLSARSYPAWARITEPYLVSDLAFVVKDPAVRQFADLPPGAAVGSRSLSSADNQLISYLLAQPEETRARRQSFYSNDQVVAALRDGRLAAAMVWRPALEKLVGKDFAAAGLTEIALPFEPAPVELGIMLESANGYLQVSLSDAIRALVADGSIQRALDETLDAGE